MKKSAYSYSAYGQMRDRIAENESNFKSQRIVIVRDTRTNKTSGVKYNNYTNYELVKLFNA